MIYVLEISFWYEKFAVKTKQVSKLLFTFENTIK